MRGPVRNEAAYPLRNSRVFYPPPTTTTTTTTTGQRSRKGRRLDPRPQTSPAALIRIRRSLFLRRRLPFRRVAAAFLRSPPASTPKPPRNKARRPRDSLVAHVTH